MIRQREDIRQKQQGQPYWTSGDLNNQTFEFMGVYNPFSQYNYNLSYVYNDEERYFKERYFSFHDINGVQPMWILTPQGQIVDGDSSQIWTPDFCYGYDSGDGCVANSNLPRCRSEDDKFILLNGDFTPSMTSSSFDGDLYQSIGDCMVSCWKDCGCLGFTTHGNGTGCVIWTGTKSINNFSINPQGNSVLKYVLVSPIPNKGNAKAWIWAPIVAAVLLVFFGVGLLWYLKKRQLRQEEERQQRDDESLLELMASESFDDATNIESNGRRGSELMMFNFAFIVAATNDFSSENKLGEGGFGSVYKYAMEGTFSVKSDVFSFGVLTLEIVSGRRNASFTYLDKTVNLIGYAWELWQQGNALEFEDPTLADTCVTNQLLRAIHVALLCVQENPGDRPVMSDAISMLINDTMLLPIPKRPAFFIDTSTSSKSISAERKSNNRSINKMTITEMEAR